MEGAESKKMKMGKVKDSTIESLGVSPMSTSMRWRPPEVEEWNMRNDDGGDDSVTKCLIKNLPENLES